MGKNGNDWEGVGDNLGVMEMFYILIVVVVMGVGIFVEIH